MTKRYLERTDTGQRYEIIQIEDGKVTLKGEYREFVEPYNVARMKFMGYTLVDENNNAIVEDEERFAR